MGRDLSEADMDIVMAFAKRTASLAEYRKSLSGYLSNKMGAVAPNLGKSLRIAREDAIMLILF